MNDDELEQALAAAGDLSDPTRRAFFDRVIRASAGAAAVAALPREANAFTFEPYPRDDAMQTVVTSCAHNCGGRHMLVVHKQHGEIVRISTDDGRQQADGRFGLDTEDLPQLRACLRGRSYRQRIYSPNRLLYPQVRAGARGEGKFKRASWDAVLDLICERIERIKAEHGPTAILDQSYAGATWSVLHKSDQGRGLLGRFLGLFGSRTLSWSVPSYEGTAFSSNITFGTTADGNEDDAFAHSKLIIMWGWNPAYTFHGGNTHYYMRLAKQRGCRFVVVDPQHTDSVGAWDAWWIPIRPNTDAAMLAGMAHEIFAGGLQDQKFIERFCLGMDAGTMPKEFAGEENFRDYIFGKRDGVQKSPEWAAAICGVPAEDIRRLARMYATTKPAALKASWAPGRVAYGEQYNRMAAALQAMTGNIGIVGGSSEGVGKAWQAQPLDLFRDEFADRWFAGIKSDRWTHCVLDYPNVRREDIGLLPRRDASDGEIPNIRALWWHGSNWFNQLPNINRQIAAIRKLDFVVCQDQTMTPSAEWADVVLPACTHFERHDVGLPWYKGHYYIHRPKVIAPLGESKTDFQIFTELAWRLGFGKQYNPKSRRDYFHHDDATDEAYLREWWQRGVMKQQGVDMPWEEFKRRGVYKFEYKAPIVAFQAFIEDGEPFPTPSGKIEIFSTTLAKVEDWTRTKYGAPIPAIPKWIPPWESRASPELADYPFQLVTPHPRWRTHSIFHDIEWLRETFEHDVTMNAGDARRLGIVEGDTVEVWNARGRIVLPVRVTERCLPGVVAVHEGVWMDRDETDGGTDRAGNPDFLIRDASSPAGAFAFNTALVNLRKSSRFHRPGWNPVPENRDRFRAGKSPRDLPRIREAIRRIKRASYEPVIARKQLGFIHNTADCIGCRACEIACKDKNSLPPGPRLRRVMNVEGGQFPAVFAFHVNLACNHCALPACVPTCPTGALTKRASDGIVDLDSTLCIGCRRCEAACPYGAPQYDPVARLMFKCNLCVDEIDAGRKPYCVMACMMRVLDVGPIDRLRAGTQPTKAHKAGDKLVGTVTRFADPALTRPSIVFVPHRDMPEEE